MLDIDLAWGQMQGARKSQQDTAAILSWPNGFRLLLLADGMGGQVGGDIASKLVVDRFKQHFTENSSAADIRSRLIAAMNAANLAVAEAVAAQPELAGMGTTLVAVAFDGTAIQWLSVGDSPMWLIRQGNIARLNEDHSMAVKLAERVAAGEMTAEQAARAPERSQLLEAILGETIELCDAPATAMELYPGDWLVIASDGVETCSEPQIRTIAEQSSSADYSSEAFISTLLDSIESIGRPSQDNASMIALRVLNSDQEPSTAQPASGEVITAQPKSR
ncbi:PP2C family protein-serine/threonine phosphatase [Halioxenophilus sp. WMMB6]|uniref:PP2C family protein-serine/threonine phosphatase n=1 Tax=Halioxenophilus sp. WMMB6 TaxID=3073815 RepID=UPI00295E5962|nr:protein phosphatase 2C domain-containing protein [Halioxenophilus sp. WMMB6]